MQERDRSKLFQEIAVVLNEAIDISTTMELILPKLSHALGLSTAWAFRYDPNQRSFVEVGASGLPPALACDHAAPLKSGWCECQSQFVSGQLNTAVNIVRCSRLRNAVGDTQSLLYHACIPLRSKGKALGILNLAASGETVFTEEVLEFLNTVGQQVAVAVDRAGLLADARRRSEKLRLLSDVAAELVSVVNPENIPQYACEKFVDALGYPACGITAVEPSGEFMLIAAAEASEADIRQEYSYTADDAETETPEAERLLLPDAKSSLSLPVPRTDYQIRIESNLMNAFNDIDREILMGFAWHVAAAIENAQLYQQSMAGAKWAERRRLAAGLHDAVSQRLFSALLLTRTVHLLLDASEDVETIRNTVNKVQEMIAEGQSEMRALIQALRPTGERDFRASLRERIEGLQLQGETRIQLCLPNGSFPDLPFEVRENALHVVDEALQNVLKYAKAKTAQVTCTYQDHLLRITIQDDGVGFQQNEVKLGLGTTTMYERMARINGSLEVHSEPGRGTTVIAEWSAC